MTKLMLLILLVAMLSLIMLQTNRSIVMRSFGLFLIFACALLNYVGVASHYLPKLLYLGALLAIGFMSDYFAASLRTWYYRVSPEALWGIVIGGVIGFLVFQYVTNITGFLLFSILGALIGELRAKGYRSFRQLMKSTFGACAGLFGMSLKLLLGMEMIYLLLRDLPPRAAGTL